jgi:hypothetical protein
MALPSRLATAARLAVVLLAAIACLGSYASKLLGDSSSPAPAKSGKPYDYYASMPAWSSPTWNVKFTVDPSKVDATETPDSISVAPKKGWGTETTVLLIVKRTDDKTLAMLKNSGLFPALEDALNREVATFRQLGPTAQVSKVYRLAGSLPILGETSIGFRGKVDGKYFGEYITFVRGCSVAMIIASVATKNDYEFDSTASVNVKGIRLATPGLPLGGAHCDLAP